MTRMRGVAAALRCELMMGGRWLPLSILCGVQLEDLHLVVKVTLLHHKLLFVGGRVSLDEVLQLRYLHHESDLLVHERHDC